MSTWAVVPPFTPLDEVDVDALESIIEHSYYARARATGRVEAARRDEDLVGWVDRLAQAHNLAEWADRVHLRATMALARRARGY